MSTATKSKVITAPKPQPERTTAEIREAAVMSALVGTEYRDGHRYTEEQVQELIETAKLQQLLEIDGNLIQNSIESIGGKAAVAKEDAQFQMRLAYVKSALTIDRIGPNRGLRTDPWVLAVTNVQIVPKQFGQTLTVTTDISAPLWTTEEEQEGRTIEIRSSFRGTIAGYEIAESINFFEDQQSYDKPLLIKGTPAVTPSGEPIFVIQELCIDANEASVIKKKRAAAAAAVVAEQKRLKKEEAALKRELKAQEKAEKAAARKVKAAERAATKKGGVPRKRKARPIATSTAQEKD